MDPEISLQVKDEDAYYFVQWSPIELADRWTINAKVPAVGGVYEIYWMDDEKNLRILAVGSCRYGGLRSEIRRLTDAELELDEKTRKLLEEKEIYFRYSITNSVAIMADVVWFLRSVFYHNNPGVSHSGRFKMIYLNESAPNKLIWVD